MKKPRHQVTQVAEDMSRPKMPPRAAVAAAGHEMKANPPAILAQTAKKKGKKAAQRQKIAIMLSKARKGE